MRWWSWARRVETNDWRSLAYLYSAFSDRSPCARATLISLGSSSWSSCSSAAISAFSFFFIFSARSIILGIVKRVLDPNQPSKRVFDVYLKIIEELRGVSQMGVSPPYREIDKAVLVSAAALKRRRHRAGGAWPV